MVHNNFTFPLELQYMILDQLFLEYHAATETYKITPAREVLPTLSVCKSWNHYGSRLFYRKIFFHEYLLYYRFATSILRGAPKGLGSHLAQLIAEVVFIVPNEVSYDFRKSRFASVPKAVEAVLRCCPRLKCIDIREASEFNFRRGGDTICMFFFLTTIISLKKKT